MNEESPQPVYVPRSIAARSRMFRALLYRDKTPLAMLWRLPGPLKQYSSGALTR